MDACNGVEALNKVASDRGLRIDLLITDVLMPEMSGPDLSKKLLKKYPNLKVLYISGYTDDYVMQQGMLDEEIHFLQKPFTPQALANRVREVLA
jgi:YesN/AraC family two-component response regulator